MKEQKIKSIIDIYLEKWVSVGLNKFLGQVDPAMSDPTQAQSDEWRIWLPIDSKVSDNDIVEVESRIGYKLPEDYKVFLKHKHFYELNISETVFCTHSINTWKDELTEMIFEFYPTEDLIEKGYIPFADWSDWGVLCFDTNKNQKDNNYPIVLWDHEIPDKVQDMYKDFYDLLVELDKEDRQNSM